MDFKACTLTALNYGDKVKINHAHTFKSGYWKDWVPICYIYKGVKEGRHHFSRCNYEHESFSMKTENEGSSILIGVLKNSNE